MESNLLSQAIRKFIFGIIIVGLLLFIPAGTIAYWNAWLFMCLLFIPMLIGGMVMASNNPDLLRKRLNAKEKETEQKQVVLISGLMFISGFIVAGLNYRFGWIKLSEWVIVAASAIFTIGYMLYAEVIRENEFLSRTIEVQENQKVIDTGLYGVVRHPMYFATLLLFLSMPLILGSIQAFIIFLIYPIVIIKRIKNEEQVLEKELPGYIDYKKKTKYRLIPFIW